MADPGQFVRDAVEAVTAFGSPGVHRSALELALLGMLGPGSGGSGLLLGTITDVAAPLVDIVLNEPVTIDDTPTPKQKENKQR